MSATIFVITVVILGVLLAKKGRGYKLLMIPVALVGLFLVGGNIPPEQRAEMDRKRGEREQAAAVAEADRRYLAAIAEADAAKAREAERVRQDAACRPDLQCWASKHMGAATSACRPLVESSASRDYRWTAWIEKFSHYRWANQAAGTVVYIGDEIEMQNGFGAWMRHTYACEFDTSTRTARVINVRAGRI
ncbi:hypothetical protein [Roseomonas sp. WA12]